MMARLKKVSGLSPGAHGAAVVIAGTEPPPFAADPIQRRAIGASATRRTRCRTRQLGVAAEDVALHVGEIDGDGAHHPIPTCSRIWATEYPG